MIAIVRPLFSPEAACDLCRFEASYANVISGEEEGVYGWIAVNYLNGHLAPSALPAPIVSCPPLFALQAPLCKRMLQGPT